MAEWFDQFFEEKKLPSEIFKVEYKGITYWLESKFVIFQIKSSLPVEREKIKKLLIRIDSENGDINDYLRFLAEAYIKTHY